MIVAQELKNGRRVAILQLDAGQTKLSKQPVGPRTFHWLFQSVFLPEGYPASVTEDYAGYQLWDSVQALATYVRGILSSQALLAGVGVGRSTATPLSAALQFFWKDLTGMLGGILFATYQGTGLDAFAKQWRLFADCANDLGLALELASPLFPGAFLLLACLGSVCRAVVGVAGGATRMALTQHFALQRNAADIAAKEGSQETATTLIGMVLGMLFTAQASESAFVVWALFLALTALHIYANVRAMRCLRITSLNQSRLEVLLRNYIATGRVLTPAQIAAEESLVPPPFLSLLHRLGLRPGELQVDIAPSLSSMSPYARQHVAEALVTIQLFQDKSPPWLVTIPPGSSTDRALLLLRTDATPADVLQGFCVALLRGWNHQLQRPMLARARPPRWVPEAQRRQWPPEAQLLLAKSSAWVSQGFPAFRQALAEAGWAVERVALSAGQTRLEWGEVVHTA